MGAKLCHIMRDVIRSVPTLNETLIKAIARQTYDEEALEAMVTDARRVIATALGIAEVEPAFKPAQNDTRPTCVWALILKS